MAVSFSGDTKRVRPGAGGAACSTSVHAHPDALEGRERPRAQLAARPRYLPALRHPPDRLQIRHLAHHRYDNDFDTRGFPKDFQSTYLFSKDGRTTNIWLYCAFYIVVYQHAIHFFHVLNCPRRREIIWYAFEYALIIALHVALYTVAPGFYLGVYLPALLLAWLVGALSVYMMHAVNLDQFRLHPTLNTRNRLYNWLGNNEGYHLEPSLYPNIHPLFLDKVSRLIGTPSEQVLDGTYAAEALRRLFRGRPQNSSAPATPAARSQA